MGKESQNPGKRKKQKPEDTERPMGWGSRAVDSVMYTREMRKEKSGGNDNGKEKAATEKVGAAT